MAGIDPICIAWVWQCPQPQASLLRPVAFAVKPRSVSRKLSVVNAKHDHSVVLHVGALSSEQNFRKAGTLVRLSGRLWRLLSLAECRS